MAHSKITDHPDKEYIIQQLLEGVNPSKIAAWLKEQYPDNKECQMDQSALAMFRRKHLNMDREAIRMVKNARKRKELGIPENPRAQVFISDNKPLTEEQEAIQIKNSLMMSASYREKLKEITDAAIDGPRLMKEMSTLLQSRLEVYYNVLASANTTTEALKADKMFIEIAALMKDIVKDSKKIWDDYNAQPDEGTIDLNVVHEMIGVVRDVVKEMFGEIDAELALEFMDRLNTRMSAMKFELPKPPELLKRVKRLSKQVEDLKTNGAQ